MATDSSRLDVLRRRVQQDPASIAFAPLAEELRRAGEHYEAVRVCLAGLEHHPAFLSARVTLGRALAALDQYQEARTEFEYVLKVAPDNLLASRSLAELEAQCLVAAPQTESLPRGAGSVAGANRGRPRRQWGLVASAQSQSRVDRASPMRRTIPDGSAPRNLVLPMALPTSSQLSDRQARVRRRLDVLNLDGFRRHQPREYSLSQQSRRFIRHPRADARRRASARGLPIPRSGPHAARDGFGVPRARRSATCPTATKMCCSSALAT